MWKFLNCERSLLQHHVIHLLKGTNSCNLVPRVDDSWSTTLGSH